MLVVLHEFTIEVARAIQFREVERLVHIAHLVNDVALIAQLYDERICVLSQQLHAIECGFEHIVVEVVDDVLEQVENGKPDEEWLLHSAHRCIQFDIHQILGIHGSPSNYIVPILLNDGLTFIPCCGELHFHSLQSSLHEFSIGGVCQQLVQVLLHCGLGFGSFLTQHVHILEYEWCLFESNDVVNVSDAISLLNAQLQQCVMHEILLTRHKIADEFRCIHLFNLVHDVVLCCVLLDSIRVHTRLLYGEEWQIIELIMEFHWCLDITLDEESNLAECLE